MGRVEDIINAAKTNEMLSELLHIKKEEEKKQNVLMWVLIVGCETNAFFAATEKLLQLTTLIKLLM